MAIKEFWSDIVTKKSWGALLKLRKLPIAFVLIGGWAAYLWTRTHKSKDVDIVLKGFEALDYLKQNYDLRKNERLKKYEIKIDEIDIDIYVPFFSKLGIPAEELVNYSTELEGFAVVLPEALLVLKQIAELERRGSLKGEKDILDIMSLLLNCEVSFAKYGEILRRYKLTHLSRELSTLVSSFDLKRLSYLGVNPRAFKLKKLEILEKLKCL